MRAIRHASLVALLTVAGCGANAAGRLSPADPAAEPASLPSTKPRSDADPVAATLQTSSARVRAGDTFEVSVVLVVAPLYEIHPLSAPPPDVATRLELSLPTGFHPVDEWSEPATVRSERPGARGAHAGGVTFARTIRIDDDVPPGPYGVTCSIRYQACDARQCLPPTSFTLLTSVSVEPHTQVP
jgi:hypothetical protein